MDRKEMLDYLVEHKDPLTPVDKDQLRQELERLSDEALVAMIENMKKATSQRE